MAAAFVGLLGSTNRRGSNSNTDTTTIAGTVASGNTALAFVFARGTTGAGGSFAPNSITGHGLTWTLRETVGADASSTMCLSLWEGNGTPSAGDLTINHPTSIAACEVHCFEVSGVDTTTTVGSNRQTGSGTGTNDSVVLPSTPSELVIACIAHAAREAHTTSTSTEIYDLVLSGTPNNASMSAYHAAPGDTFTFSYATSSAWIAIIAELQAAGGGPVNVTPSALAEVSAFPATIIRRTPITTTLASTTAFPAPTVDVPISPWRVNGTLLELEGVVTTIKGVNQYMLAGWGDDGLTTQFTGATLAAFASFLASQGINVVRFPLVNDTTTGYKNGVKEIVEAFAAENIYTLLDPQDHSTFGVWPGAGNSVSTTAANFLVTLWNWIDAADRPWVLMETFNEPNSAPGSPNGTGDLSDAQWLSGTNNAITIIRAGGYDGPIFCDGNGWSWAYPSNAASISDPLNNIVLAPHRYATNDGTNYMGDEDAFNDADSQFGVSWKTEWIDGAADTDGFCIVQGEWGPYNGGLGGNTLAYNLANWCTNMKLTMEDERDNGLFAGEIGWIAVWSDENTTLDYSDFPSPLTVLDWGDLVYGMFDVSDQTVIATTLASVTAFPTATKVIQKAVTSLAEVTAFPAPTIIGNSRVTPSALAEVSSFPAPAIQGAALITPGALAEVTAFPAPLVAIAIKPSALAEVTSFPTPTVQGFASVAAVALASVTAFPSVTIQAGTSPVPSALAEVTAFPSALVAGGGRVTASALVSVDALPAPAVAGNARSTPSALSELTAFPSAIIRRTPIPTTLTSFTLFPVATVSAPTNVDIPPITDFRLTGRTMGQFRTSGRTVGHFELTGDTMYQFRIA